MDDDASRCVLQALRDLYIENLSLRAILQGVSEHLPPQQELDDLIARAKRDTTLQEIAAEQFSEMRSRIEGGGDLAAVLKEFLKIVPPKDDVN